MRLCNFGCCKFLYLKSFILFRKYFSKLKTHKVIKISVCIISKILTLPVEHIPSALSTSLFSFSSDFAVVSPIDCNCLSFLSALCTLKLKNTSNDVNTRMMYDHRGNFCSQRNLSLNI